MANKYDLKTWVRQSLLGPNLSAALSNAVIGSDTADAGKTRFLTYLRVQRARITVSSAQGSMVVSVGECDTSIPSGASIMAAANLKAELYFPGAATGVMPETGYVQELKGTIEHPIISVAGGTYLGVHVGTAALGSVANIFAQYYDE